MYKEPPVNLGKHYNELCNRNYDAYTSFKKYGINGLAKQEQERFKKKVELQNEAQELGISDSKMLQFAKKCEKEALWKRLPKDLLE